ncbi:MAG: sulfite exporter TauE/SafE family protein [Candidatus Desulfaltia sp.]|nr:sulfite exporter TauE/SafE family protein [Candidatus Desulfaltia sp.]
MTEVKDEKRMGWESAREIEAEKATMAERAMLTKENIKTLLMYSVAFVGLFAVAWWLAGCPFEFTQRLPSEYVVKHGLVGTTNWTIVWYVVFMCAFFEFMDSAGGMGYGTALTPLMLIAGFDPKQVVPCVMITEAFTGLIAGMVHSEFGNVEWSFSPLNETTKLTVLVCAVGIVCVCFSITAAYKVLKVHKVWIKLYVAVLLVVMGICSLMTAKKYTTYRPKWMILFAGLGGFNKGVGGGGYGPVITVGGLLAGVPVKSMVAITSLAEGVTCVFAVGMWFILLSTGVVIDYMLLPSFVIGTVIAAVAAPYVTRIFSEKFWKILVPTYCCILAVYCFYKIIPSVIKKLKAG